MPELKTPAEWQKDDPIKIFDPDGWRMTSPETLFNGMVLVPRNWDEPISHEEYVIRRRMCTCYYPPGSERKA